MKKKSDNFINLKFNYWNMQIYAVRLSIFNSIQENLNYFSGHLLDIGCGKMPYKEYILKNSKVRYYIGLDIENALVYDKNVKPDIKWNGSKIPSEDNKFDTVLATEVLEHCPQPEIIFKEAYRVLKNKGVFFITVPFIFPLHESPHDEYRYTPYAIERLAKEAGFKKLNTYPLGGINASLAQVLSFWPKNKYIRLLVLPIIYLLVKTDKKPEAFNDNVFFTGLCSIFVK